MASKNKGKANRKKAINHGPRPKINYTLVRNWTELSKQTSETHFLEIDFEGCCGRIYSKTDPDFYQYLSTHTFYGKTHTGYTGELRKCGFNITLDNWDRTGLPIE